MQLTNNEYRLSSGVNPIELIDKYGSPLYVYDAAIIEKQYNKMKNAFQVPHLHLNYACKALTNISIIKFLRSLGAGLDCVSLQEVKMGLEAGYDPHEIIYTPSGVSLEEVKSAMELGVRLNADNLSLLEFIGRQEEKVPVCIRINPHVFAGGNEKISVGHEDSKFGISFSHVPHILELVKKYGLLIEGLHIHTGSDILNVQSFIQATEVLMDVAMQFPDLDYLDFGSGFKVAYKEEDKATNIEEFGARFSARFNRFCKEYGREIGLHFEPGKIFVSQSGYFLVKVNVVKKGATTTFLGVDSGMNHLIRPMYYGAFHKIVNLSNPTGTIKEYDVVGYICETDTFAKKRPLPETKEGDILAFFNAGAYCFSMASNYNSRLRPAEVMVYKGKDYLIRKRETYENLVQNQVLVDVFQEQLIMKND